MRNGELMGRVLSVLLAGQKARGPRDKLRLGQHDAELMSKSPTMKTTDLVNAWHDGERHCHPIDCEMQEREAAE